MERWLRYAATEYRPWPSAILAGTDGARTPFFYCSNALHLRYPCHRFLHLLRRVGVVLQLAGEVLVVGGEVEVAVAAEVEEDGAPFARLAGGQRLVDGGAEGAGGLRGPHAA